MNRTAISLFLGFATICYGIRINANAQSYPGGGFQSNQIGPNAFVSGPKGEVYTILDNQLYHDAQEAGDSWDLLASNIKAVAVDPQNEKVIYGIDTNNHVTKSLDAGHKWLTLDIGIRNLSLLSISVNPTNPQEILVGSTSGLLETTDAGFSWHQTSFTIAVNQIVFDPRIASNRYLLSAGVVFVSSDGGTTWRISQSGMPSEIVRGAARTATKVTAHVSLLMYVGWEKPFLLAATFAQGVLRSDDEGNSWKFAGTGLDTSERLITGSVGKKEIVLSSSDHLYRSIDGATWTKLEVSSGRNIPLSFSGVIEYPKRDGLLLNFRFPQDGQIENVGEQRRVGFLDTRGVLVGLNYGVLNHSEVDNVWASIIDGKTALFAITANLADLDQVERSHRPVFLYSSTDDGYSWELLGKPDCGELAARPRDLPSEVWVYGNSACITRSQDGGATWEHMPGIDTAHIAQGTTTSLEFDPKDRNIAYYSGSLYELSIFRYQYNPSTKQGQSVDLKTIATDVLIDQDDPSHLFTDTAQLSTDGGWTWTDKSKSYNATCKCEDMGRKWFGPVKLLSYSGSEIRTLVSFNGNAFNGYPGDIEVVRSQDSGETWNIVSKLAVHKLLAGPFVNPDDPMNAFIAALTAPAGTPGTFGSSYRPDMVKLLETKDGGASWNEIYRHAAVGQYGGNGLIRGVAQLKRAGGRSLLLATSEGLLGSDNDGGSWHPMGGVQ